MVLDLVNAYDNAEKNLDELTKNSINKNLIGSKIQTEKEKEDKNLTKRLNFDKHLEEEIEPPKRKLKAA